VKRLWSCRRWLPLLVVGLLLAAACTNDPFDPARVANQPPTVRFFVEPVDPDGELNPTSYYARRFYWSGTDPDGHVVEYYVSVRTDPDVAAPWDTTTATDTTMTFTTDDQGEALAIFYLACRDDRGAYSDTLIQRVPLRNFPPILNFQSDYRPLANMQREFVYDNGAVVDTVYWNWGVMNVRMFAFDLDGNETMDSFYRYTAADTEPTTVLPWDDPQADPMQHWLAVPFLSDDEIIHFELRLRDLPPGPRTLTVAVSDEAAAETRLTLSWEVRAPRGPLLVVPDNSGTATRAFYRGFLADRYGTDGWDEYDFWFGLPDDPWVLLESMRQYQAVLWFDGGGVSTIFRSLARRNGVIEQYITPVDGAEPGRFFLISRNLTGGAYADLNYFRQNVLGVNPTGNPPTALIPVQAAVGVQAIGSQPWLPPMTLVDRLGRGIGLNPLAGSEALYQFEECVRCFGNRPPWDPIIGLRRPERATSAHARVVGLSFQLEAMDQDEAWNVLAAILEHELGVDVP
jgi:hypothetical protein